MLDEDRQALGLDHSDLPNHATNLDEKTNNSSGGGLKKTYREDCEKGVTTKVLKFDFEASSDEQEFLLNNENTILDNDF